MTAPFSTSCAGVRGRSAVVVVVVVVVVDGRLGEEPADQADGSAKYRAARLVGGMVIGRSGASHTT